MKFAYLSIFILFLSNTVKVNNASSSTFDGRLYDKTQEMVFENASQEQINSYYTYVDNNQSYSLNDDTTIGEEFKSKLYSIISTHKGDENYFVAYDKYNQWTKIVDRNWDLSRDITPSTYKFEDDGIVNGELNYTINVMYFPDNSSKAKAVTTEVNTFTKDESTTKVDYANKTRPSTFYQIDKEHLWAKSHGFGGSDIKKGAGTDLHHLIAADHNTNSAGHNDLDYGEVDKSNSSSYKEIYCYYADGSTALSGYRGKDANNNEVFEPIDQYKGDIARSLFYMATRYSSNENNSIAEPYLYLTDDLSKQDDNSQFIGVIHNLSTLLKWNELDPVSDNEIKRNNMIYFNVQDNRNPYIDNPEWVNRVFDENYTLADYTLKLNEKYQGYVNSSISIPLTYKSDFKNNISFEYDNQYLELASDYKFFKCLKEVDSTSIKISVTEKSGEIKEYTSNIQIKSAPKIEQDQINNQFTIKTNESVSLTLPEIDKYEQDEIYLTSSNTDVATIKDLTITGKNAGSSTVNVYLKSSDLTEDILLYSINITVEKELSSLEKIMNAIKSNPVYLVLVFIGLVILLVIFIIIFVKITKKDNKSKPRKSKKKK